MEWEIHMQEQGRIKIPQHYISYKKLKVGDKLKLVEKRSGLLLVVRGARK